MVTWSEIIREGKVEKIPLGQGGMTVLIIDPTRAQFAAALRSYDDQTARFVLNPVHVVIGDHYHWTHHALATHTMINGTINGWLADDRAVVWGSADLSDFPHDQQEAGLIAANQPDYDALLRHPIFRRLYPSVPKIGFTCNDGAMISFLPDHSHAIEDIDVTLIN